MDFENLISTEKCLEDFLDTMSELDEKNRKEQQSSIVQTEKALVYLKTAIFERCDEMITIEKEMLCDF